MRCRHSFRIIYKFEDMIFFLIVCTLFRYSSFTSERTFRKDEFEVLPYGFEGMKMPYVAELAHNISAMYENLPESYTNLMNTAADYAKEFERIYKLVKANDTAGIKLMQDVRYFSATMPVRRIPWVEMIDKYDWNNTHVDRLFGYIDDVNRFWRYFSDRLSEMDDLEDRQLNN